MRLLAATLLASTLILGPVYASTLDLTVAAFDQTFDGGIPAFETFDGVTFTITPTARGVDGFRQNSMGLNFGVPGNGMFTISIVADQDITFNSITGLDNSNTAQTTGILFNGTVGASSVFSNHIFGASLGALDFADVTVSAGDAFLVSADLSARPGFNSVFAQATIGSIEFSAAPISAVPLPAGLPLLLVGIGALGIVRRRK